MVLIHGIAGSNFCSHLQPQIIVKYGYKTETYRRETYDGFVVEMHRITASPISGRFDPSKPPVLLIHGLLGSSADWIMTGPQNGLPYLLSNLGYDVWLGNARGSRYSREHTYLTADMKEYWDFSWHEIGIYDIPTMIDFVLKTTRFEKIHYVGYSQGTTAFFVMTSLMPKYNDKIIKLHALAPAAYMTHLSNPVFRYLAAHLSTVTVSISRVIFEENECHVSIFSEFGKRPWSQPVYASKSNVSPYCKCHLCCQ